MLDATISRLRLISLIEGISYLLLISVGMPLKYMMQMPMPNKILGMGHGVLTVLFVVILFQVWSNKKIATALAIQTFVASLIPFGAFYIESKLKKIN